MRIKYALVFILGMFLGFGIHLTMWSLFDYRYELNLPLFKALNLTSGYGNKEYDIKTIYLLDQVSKSDLSRPEAFSWIGKTFKDNECDSLAIDNFTKAIQIHEKAGSGNNYLYKNHYEIAEVYDRTKDHSSAEKHYINGMNLQPNHPDPYWKLANLYLLLGDQKKAKEHFRLFIKHESRKDEKADEILKAEKVIDEESMLSNQALAEQ